ncbi:hypothetical protein IC744_14010 [Microbacterium hominis]|uniref:hypothetical protein n=1 Tax=Microbacterium TaxID=33882 RepID=UPI00168AFC49|nr:MULTISPECIES: hypothetical protein [Microbacterium]QOC24395.1 hypothetical protein IC745_08250 [Microbacterium hominis]QOC28473.1 hypothetical protein IC744_14010 [Microbacterium hominis]QYF96324.1 hypothetical protein KY498_08895 [Microbacterium sp. PAMC21962]
MADWYTAEDDDGEAIQRLKAAWEEVPYENLETLRYLLTTAKEQVIALAPAAIPPQNWETAPLDRYVYAQLLQAQNLWNAGRVQVSGDIGDGQYVFTPRPLDKTIQQIVRPPDRSPYVL